MFEWMVPQPVDDCLRVLASCLLGGMEVTPLMCSTTETLGPNSANCKEDTVSACLSPCCIHMILHNNEIHVETKVGRLSFERQWWGCTGPGRGSPEPDGLKGGRSW